MNYGAATPRRFANLPQIRVDSILWDQADRAWPGRVRAQHELVDVAYDDEGATATVLDRLARRTHQVRSRSVIAADGGRTCSGLLDVGVVGPRALMDNVTIFMSADLSKHAESDGLITFFVNPDGQGSYSGAILALGPGEVGLEVAAVDPEPLLPGRGPGADDEQVLSNATKQLGTADLDMTVTPSATGSSRMWWPSSSVSDPSSW